MKDNRYLVLFGLLLTLVVACASQSSGGGQVANAEQAQVLLEEIAAARTKALVAGAEELDEPFKAAEQLYFKVNEAAEKENFRFVRSKAAELKNNYRELEVLGIKDQALGPARDLLRKAMDDRLEKIVPQTLTEARQALVHADTEIERNLYDSKQIEAQAGQALFMVQRAMALAATIRRLRQLDDESAALHLERQMARLGKTLAVDDMRNRSFEEQVAVLGNEISRLRRDHHSLTDLNYAYQRQISAMEERIVGLKGFASRQEASIARLEQARVLDQRIDQAQKLFAGNEAEVLKQGDQVVVRLRAIEFAAGSSALPPRSLALLAKANKALDLFNSEQVLVEGHSDNTGSAEKNQTLSRERAEAVRAYLFANSTVAGDRIRAVGRGPDRPIAPNDSAAGRAMNRRIDLLVTPGAFP